MLNIDWKCDKNGINTGLFRIKTGLLGNERKTSFSTSANTKTGSRKYENRWKNIENGTVRYGKNSVRFHPYYTHTRDKNEIRGVCGTKALLSAGCRSNPKPAADSGWVHTALGPEPRGEPIPRFGPCACTVHDMRQQFVSKSVFFSYISYLLQLKLKRTKER
jgi:hypothetical protein